MPEVLDDKQPQMARQLELPFMQQGEARPAVRSGEAASADEEPTDPGRSGLLERVLERDNLLAALKRVCGNKGGPGVDGMTVDELGPYLRDNWLTIREQLLSGVYQPQPVRRKLIPKGNGKTRELGIPTVLDRFIQQALLQVLQPMYDPTFSDHSHGFRPGRSTHDALREARDIVQGGRTWVVDVDLAKFFDTVNHDILMGRLARRVEDGRILRLIRRYLSAGMMADGVTIEGSEGTPQGGPLSPLLANILLDEVDKELEARGHAFVRYADDSRVFVRSKRAGHRVMRILHKLYGALHLVINEQKSAVAPFGERPFLGYTMFQSKRGVALVPSDKSKARIRDTIKELTRRSRGWSLDAVIRALAPKIRGWANYFSLTTFSNELRTLDKHIRRRLRALILSQWRTAKRTRQAMRALGADERQIRFVTGYLGRWWRGSLKASNMVLTNAFFRQRGLPAMAP